MNGAESTTMLLLRVGMSLAIVFALIWVAARVARRRGRVGTKVDGPQIELVERRNLGKRTSVVLLRVGGKALLVGSTDQQVSLLSEAPHLDTRDDEITVVELPQARPVQLSEVRAERAAGLVRPDGSRAGGATARTGGAQRTRPPKLSLADAVREMTARRG